jgi:hypothetical protein
MAGGKAPTRLESVERTPGWEEVERPSWRLIWVAAAIVVVGRQFLPRTVNPLWLLGTPLVMGYFGVQAVLKTPPETALATALFAANLAAAVALGLARGASSRLWRAADGTWMQRGTLLTLGLWVLSVAVRVGLGLAGHLEAELNTVVLFLAVTFGAQNLVVWLRTGGARTATAVGVR